MKGGRWEGDGREMGGRVEGGKEREEGEEGGGGMERNGRGRGEVEGREEGRQMPHTWMDSVRMHALSLTYCTLVTCCAIFGCSTS